MTASVRSARPGDGASLEKLWQAVFGDGPEYTGGFFARMYEPRLAVCAEADGEIVSMALAPGLGTLRVPGSPDVPCGYVYAVATLPRYRGQGLAARVSSAAAELWLASGGAAAICPAEPSLFAYYRDKCNFSNFFKVFEQSYTMEYARERAGLIAFSVSSGEYSRERERLLSGTAHIELSPRAAEYQEHLCLSSGGGLFAVPGGGIFAAERAGGRVLIKEMLGGGAVLPSVFATLPAESYEVRAPAVRGKAARDFAMLRPRAVALDGPFEPWLGFAFD